MTNQVVGNLINDFHNEEYNSPFEAPRLTCKNSFFSENRPKESLNGRWYFVLDQYDTGLRSDWFYAKHRNATETTPYDYSVDQGTTIEVPSCWNMAKPEYHYYEGSAWYARNFPFKPYAHGERVMLRVGAANYECKVFLNGKFLGSHLGGSTPFSVELTPWLQEDNWLQLWVNNDRTLERVPMRNTDWFNYGGVYRDVALFRLPPDFLTELHLYLVPDGQFDKIMVETAVSNIQANDTVSVNIPELGLEKIIKLKNGRGSIQIACTPELWNPISPKLYQVVARYKQDHIMDYVGFRQITVHNGALVLNGKPIFLRGISVHEDDLLKGKCSSEEDVRLRFAHAKELGCNFVRLAHYPHSELAPKIADQLGLLLWEEIPVYWAINFSNSDTYADAKNQLLELIYRDRNRSSVIIWSVGNENADTDDRLQFMSSLAQIARHNDPSRLVSAACLVNHNARRIEDRLEEHLDVIGINEYYGWYSPHFEEWEEILSNSRPGKPVIVSETGAGAQCGHHGPVNELFTEEHQASVYRKQIRSIEKSTIIHGMTPWILYDFRTPKRQNKFQTGFNRKGLIDADKCTKKSAFYVLQEYYKSKITSSPNNPDQERKMDKMQFSNSYDSNNEKSTIEHKTSENRKGDLLA